MSKNKYIFLNGLIDLAQSRLGSKIVYKTDEFFAPAKRIINSWTPVFKEGVFDKHGKWMDGWETKRKRSCLLYTSPSPRDKRQSRMPSSA